MDISGSIFAAMLTPFGDDGAVAPEGIAPLVDFILSRGVHGLYVGGSSGEAMLQNVEERSLVLRQVADVAKGRCSLIAHVGTAATCDAVALAKLVGQMGYDAVSAVPPYYYKHSFPDISDYYKAIADASGLPLIIYNIPALSGTDIPTEQLLELMQDDRIAGVKFTATDLFQFSQLRQQAPGKKFYFGTDEMFLGAAAMGSDGGIGSTYNLIGDVYVGIEKAINAGDIATARQLQRKSGDLVKILLETGVLPGLKHALNRLGVPVGPCRRPFSAASPASLAKLDAWMDANGLSV